MDGPALPALLMVLERARSLGFLGPGPVEEHVEHARGFARAIDGAGLAPGGESGSEPGSPIGADPATEPDAGSGPPGSPGDGRIVDVGADPDAGSDGDAGRPGPPSSGRIADIGAGGGVPGLVLLVEDPTRALVLIDASRKRCSFLVWALAELGLADRAEVWCGRAEEIGHEDRAREHFAAVVARGFGPPATTLECATPLVRPGGVVVISEPPERRSWPADGLAELALSELPGTPGMAVFRRLDGLDPSYPRPSKQQQRSPRFQLG